MTFLQTKHEIENWLISNNIKKYTLIPNKKYFFIVDVNDDVNLDDKGLNEIPVKFNIVNGHFSCSNNNLASLEFSPIKATRSFTCDKNKLISLKGAPIEIGSSFRCSYNQLTSLKYSPRIIPMYFYCDNNNLSSLKYCPTFVGLSLNCQKNKINTLEFCPEHVGEKFFCDFNPGLGEHQLANKFTEIKEIQKEYLIKKEHSKLSRKLKNISNSFVEKNVIKI